MLFRINQKGMSLIEMSIVMVVMGILSVGLANLFSNMAMNQARVLNFDSFKDLESQVKKVILSTANCGVKDLNPGTIGVTSWNNNTKYNLTGLESIFIELSPGGKYDRMILNNIIISAPLNKTNNVIEYVGLESGDPAVDSKILAAINIDVSFLNTSYKNQVSIPVHLGLNPALNKIISCTSEIQNEDLSNLCSGFGGEWDAENTKCNLPCPDGFLRDESNKCVAEDSLDSGDPQYCSNIDACTVHNRFMGSSYK